MNQYYIYTGIGIVALILLLIAFFIWRKLRKKKIPEDVLNDFNEAEKMYADNKGRLTQQEVLHELNKKRLERFYSINPYHSSYIKQYTPKENKLSKLFRRK